MFYDITLYHTANIRNISIMSQLHLTASRYSDGLQVSLCSILHSDVVMRHKFMLHICSNVLCVELLSIGWICRFGNLGQLKTYAHPKAWCD